MHKSAWFVTGMLILATAACDLLFSTRDPEPPINPQSNWVPPLYPDQVLLNLQNAVYERNLENYVRCLTDPAAGVIYRFEPDQEIAQNYPAVFLTWSRDKERSVMQEAFSLVPSDSVCFLVFPEIIREVITPDSAVSVRTYRLEMHHSQTSFPSVYEGQAELRMTVVNGEWSVYHWIDFASSDLPPWSLLKASLGG